MTVRTTAKGRAAKRARKGPKQQTKMPAKVPTFEDGTRPGDVLRVNRDESGEIVGRLVRTVLGGAIWQGACPNPKAGPGRPSKEIKAQCRNSFSARIARLEAIVDSPSSSAKDIVSAMALLGRYGAEAEREESDPDRAQAVVILPALEIHRESEQDVLGGRIGPPAPLPSDTSTILLPAPLEEP
jgi:hypothetical protein